MIVAIYRLFVPAAAASLLERNTVHGLPESSVTTAQHRWIIFFKIEVQRASFGAFFLVHLCFQADRVPRCCRIEDDHF